MNDSRVDLAVKWDHRHRAAAGMPEPVRVLRENLHLLPASGQALDLACGLGANALLLAEVGLDVEAWDLSQVAIGKLCAQAAARRAKVQPRVRDVIARPPEPHSFDVILVGYFLERRLAPDLVRALRPGGLLYYQTFTRTAVSDLGPGNPAYRLGDNELLALFSTLLIRVYREEGRLGDIRRGCRDVAMLVAEKEP